MRVLRPGLVLLQYVGAIEILFRLKVENRKHITIEPKDYVLVDDVSAVYMGKGTQFKRVDTEVDLSTFMQDKEPLEFVDDSVLMAELMEREIVDNPSLSDFTTEDIENELICRGVVPVAVTTVSDEETEKEAAEKEAAEKEAAEKEAAEKEAAEKEAAQKVVLTKANVMGADLKDIKAACKEHKITIGKNKRDDLIALLLPYLEA